MARKHKIWITLTEESRQRLLAEQKRASVAYPLKVTPSMVIDQIIMNHLPEPPKRARRRAKAETPPKEIPKEFEALGDFYGGGEFSDENEYR